MAPLACTRGPLRFLERHTSAPRWRHSGARGRLVYVLNEGGAPARQNLPETVFQKSAELGGGTRRGEEEEQQQRQHTFAGSKAQRCNPTTPPHAHTSCRAFPVMGGLLGRTTPQTSIDNCRLI